MKTMKLWRHLARAVLAAATIAACAPAPAQTPAYPTRPIRFLIANAPGGGLDVTARTVGPTVSQALGQQLIYDNRPGATGSIAAETTAKSPPDGYTILMG